MVRIGKAYAYISLCRKEGTQAEDKAEAEEKAEAKELRHRTKGFHLPLQNGIIEGLRQSPYRVKKI